MAPDKRNQRDRGGILDDLLHPLEAVRRSRDLERTRRARQEREERAGRERRERAGRKAEYKTFNELRRLIWRGVYYVFSDLPTVHAGNLDHLVVGPEGLAIVETKANSGVIQVHPGSGGRLVLTVGGRELHRDLIKQVRSQMWDVCERAGMKTGPDDTFGMNWLVCFPNGELGQGIPKDLRAHIATTADLPAKLRAPGRVMDDAMVESVASAVSTIYERPPSATPVRRPPDIGPEGRHYGG